MTEFEGLVTITKPNSSSSRIPGLDGLRAISIMLVLSGHLAGTHGCYSVEVWRHLGDLANLGVQVFFVISGFLITTLLIKEWNRTGTISLRDFYIRRTLRIFPAFYCFLGVIAVSALLGFVKLQSNDLLHAATYTMNFHFDRAWWLGHLWSLSVEEQFYFLWPACLIILGLNRSPFAPWAVVVTAPLVRIGLSTLVPRLRPGIGEMFPTIADTIAVGCLLAFYLPSLRQNTTFKKVLHSNWMAVVPALIVFLNLKSTGRISITFIETALNFLIALCVAWAVTTTAGKVATFLNTRVMVFVGTLSYSLYLWQQPFLNRHSMGGFSGFPLNLVLTFGVALLSYYFIEKPFLSLRGRRKRREEQRTRLASAAASIGDWESIAPTMLSAVVDNKG